jgi:hypothetical protein
MWPSHVACMGRVFTTGHDWTPLDQRTPLVETSHVQWCPVVRRLRATPAPLARPAVTRPGQPLAPLRGGSPRARLRDAPRYPLQLGRGSRTGRRTRTLTACPSSVPASSVPSCRWSTGGAGSSYPGLGAGPGTGQHSRQALSHSSRGPLPSREEGSRPWSPRPRPYPPIRLAPQAGQGCRAAAAQAHSAQRTAHSAQRTAGQDSRAQRSSAQQHSAAADTGADTTGQGGRTARPRPAPVPTCPGHAPHRAPRGPCRRTPEHRHTAAPAQPPQDTRPRHPDTAGAGPRRISGTARQPP